MLLFVSNISAPGSGGNASAHHADAEGFLIPYYREKEYKRQEKEQENFRGCLGCPEIYFGNTEKGEKRKNAGKE